MNALTSTRVNISPSTRSATTDVGRQLVAKFCWLERTAAVQRITAIVGLFTSGDMRALSLAKLANAARIGTATAAAGADRPFDVLTTAVAAALLITAFAC